MRTGTIAQVLGGRKTLGTRIRSRFDLMELSRKGVTKSTLLNLSKYMGISVSQMACLLPVSERTIQRYSPKDHFNPVVSEYILHIAEVMARGAEVFEDKERFLQWLKQPSAALGGKLPMDLLGSQFGIAVVLDELGRIEHGVFA